MNNNETVYDLLFDKPDKNSRPDKLNIVRARGRIIRGNWLQDMNSYLQEMFKIVDRSDVVCTDARTIFEWIEKNTSWRK